MDASYPLHYNHTMPFADQPKNEHQVGITNAQENNPDYTIRELTSEMNSHFAAGDYAEAARIALAITARSKNELHDTFVRHGTTVLHLDHEAFGIYSVIEPSYDLRVDGTTADVLAAAIEFGRNHAQEAVLISRGLAEGEADPAERLGLAIVLHADIKIDEAVEIVAVVRDCGFKGVTFAPKRDGEISIYHTDDLDMTIEQFRQAAEPLVRRLRTTYTHMEYAVRPYIVLMPHL